MRQLLACCITTGFLAMVPWLTADPTATRDTPSLDWPQWQGPDRTACSRETGLLKNWPEEGPHLVWKADKLGKGHSTPSVAAGRIFIMGSRDKQQYIIGLAEKDGKELWATLVGPMPPKCDSPGPCCTPTVDGNQLYALGLNGDLLCLDVATGKEVWRVDLIVTFQGRRGRWGYSESPLVDGERILCTPGGKKAALVALDKKTGKTIWAAATRDGNGTAHYSSIIAAKVGDQKQYIQVMSGGIIGVRDDGKFLWHHGKPTSPSNCSTPIYHNRHIFAAAAYYSGGCLVRLVPDGNNCRAEEVYFTKKMLNQHGGMVLVRDYLYGSNENSVTCLDFKTGKLMWEARQPGKGSLAYADGMIYYRNEGGPLILFEANPKQYVEHGRFEQPNRSSEPAWAHPVIANGKLYIRDEDILLCFDIKAR